ncbi:hypothetical protein AB4144_53680, partial [Rhizobiaceae sp. 2RAB30]
GNATSDGLGVGIAIGGGCDKDGNCDGGGDGGAASINTDGATIITSGSNAPGLVAQSIGGGGGMGGQAFAGSVGAGFSVSKAVGGTGGGGGDAGTTAVTVSDSLIATGQNSLLLSGGCSSTQPCNALPVDSYGVLI